MRAPADPAAPTLAITWMLPALLHRHGLSAPAFAALLRRDGYAISDSQVYRLLQREPLRYDRDLLAAICHTLECTLADLVHYDARATRDRQLTPPVFRIPGT